MNSTTHSVHIGNADPISFAGVRVPSDFDLTLLVRPTIHLLL